MVENNFSYIESLEERVKLLEEKLAYYDQFDAEKLISNFSYFLNWNLLNIATIKIDKDTQKYTVKINSNLLIDKDSEHYQFIDNFYNNILMKNKTNTRK